MKKFLTTILLIVLSILFVFQVACQQPGENIGGNGGQEEYSFSTNDLKNYQIVYSTEYNVELSTLAYKLQNAISEKYGVSLAVGLDIIKEKRDCEILLGETNRYLDSDNKTIINGKIMQYSVTVDNGTFRINAGGVFSAEKAVEYLINNVFTGEEVSLKDGEHYKKSFVSEKVLIDSEATARIMSTNVLAQSFIKDQEPFKGINYRVEIYAGVLIVYTPDIVGVQETDSAWINPLKKYLDRIKKEYDIEYSRHFAEYENTVNLTSLLYRSDKYTVGDSNMEGFEWKKDPNLPTESYHLRNVTWAQFNSKEDSSKGLIFANTHWSYGSEYVGKTLSDGTVLGQHTAKGLCKDETATIYNRLKSTYSNMPFFATGDYNASANWFASGGNYSSFSSVCSLLSIEANCVPEVGVYDHIFGSGSYTVKKMEYIESVKTTVDGVGLLTDHNFVFADVAF